MKERLALIGVTAAVMAPAVPMAQAEGPNQGPESQDQIENPFLAKMAGAAATEPVCKTETSTFSADGTGNQNGTLETTVCDVTTLRLGASEVKDSDFANGKIKILSNISTPMPKKQVKKLEKDGACFMVGEGTKYPTFLNQGYNVKNKKEYGVDTRRSEVCRVNGQLVRVACRNNVKVKLVPEEQPTIFVRNFATSKINAHAEATATTKATADCGTSSAYAEASAKASANAKVSVRMAVRTKGKSLTKTVNQIRLSAEGTVSAKAEAKAAAAAMCVAETTSTTVTPVSTPPTHGCDVTNILQKDGRTVNMTVTSDGGKTDPIAEKIAWGDGNETSKDPAPTDTTSHTYNSDSTFTEGVTLTYSDGSTANCKGSITTQQETAPPPPPA